MIQHTMKNNSANYFVEKNTNKFLCNIFHIYFFIHTTIYFCRLICIVDIEVGLKNMI
jgi:hypothetical protein